jgi:isoleucyl-tRNA synthetase
MDLKNNSLHSCLDVWVLSRLNNLIKSVDDHMSSYSSREAIRKIYDFVIDDLSNWYVRLNRKRFSRNDNDSDMAVVFRVLHVCLEKVSSLLYPFTPFFSLWMMDNLDCGEGKKYCEEKSNDDIIIAYRKRLQYPEYDEECIDVAMEEDMSFVREFVSIVLSLRRAANIKVRQPLASVLISSQKYLNTLLKYRDIILNETNIKDISFAENEESIYVVKCSFKDSFVALDTKLTSELIEEGIVREFIREMQKERKELSCSIDDIVRIYVYSEDKSFIGIIKKYEEEVNAEVLSTIVFVEDVNRDDFKPHDGYLVKVLKV